MQVVLDTFRLGGRPSPYDEYCQPAKHKDREAEAERDPADRIEHIRPAVRNVPRADDAEGQCGQQIEHKQFEPVLVCPDLRGRIGTSGACSSDTFLFPADCVYCCSSSKIHLHSGNRRLFLPILGKALNTAQECFPCVRVTELHRLILPVQRQVGRDVHLGKARDLVAVPRG